MIKQTLDLNLIPGRVLPRVNVSQYDKGTRTLEFTIYNGEILFNPTGYTAYIQGQKPDGHGFNYAATIADQKISVEVVEQMTAVSGSVACEIVIQDGTDQIGTGNFILQVEAAALPDDATMSESDYSIIQKAVEDAQEAAEEAEAWSAHAPYIGANGNWYVYDAVQEQFVDTGVQAEGPQGDEGPQGPAGPTGNGIASITKTGTSGLVDTYTITYTNGNTTTFTVTNGQNGTGSGDMTKAVYDQNNNGVVDDAEKLGGNLPAYYAKQTEVSALDTHKLGDFTTTSDVAISGVTYHTYWEVAPTASNQVYGVAVHPTNGKLTRIYNNKGTYTAVYYDANTTTGDGIKTKVAKTGTAQSAITDTIRAGTTLDNAIGTLLNNDATLNEEISELNADITANELGAEIDIKNYNSTSNLYTAPCDGYLHILANTTGTINANIYGSNGTSNVLRILVQNGDREAVFIRKGMKLMHNASGDTGSGHNIYFAPLN